jgi:uncharacterized protein
VAKEDRGFASMDRMKQREIASKGGKAAHQKGTAHEWTSEEARDAGRKGGIASHRRRRELLAQQNTGSNTSSTSDMGRSTGDETRASAREESSSFSGGSSEGMSREDRSSERGLGEDRSSDESSR